MPGRLAQFKDKDFIKDCKKLIKINYVNKLNHSFNIPPSLPVVALLNNGNYLYTHFGFFPPWAKNKNDFHINARSESIFEKQTFREAFKKRRCIIPINGFYEWKNNDIMKTPYFVRDTTNSYLAIAGIWNEYYSHELQINIVSVALLTCDANEKLNPIHHRMPVILEQKDFQTWLYEDDLQKVNRLLQIYPNENLKIYEVTNKVNKVGFNQIEAIQEIRKTSLL